MFTITEASIDLFQWMMFEELGHVIVDAINNPLSSEQYEDLCTTINLLSPSSYYGIDLYLTALSFVHNML